MSVIFLIIAVSVSCYWLCS